MKNLDSKQWEISEQESRAISELESRGFEVTIIKRTVTKDKIMIKRDGFEMEEEIAVGGNYTYKKYAEIVEKTFEMVRRTSQ